ncbi:toxic anion resistance protein [Methylonatrum kenyense]|uniref:toxic anion resistance protein n=1 Tax=Methylonatrum kenyense TaxID=455253 RepID=UPI0020BE54F6|nr:toxic anion resistance protein [Methylonatrum kenyense]MCK8515888.1 toxic anion resistance protein [Methylonatrum kenyense]
MSKDRNQSPPDNRPLALEVPDAADAPAAGDETISDPELEARARAFVDEILRGVDTHAGARQRIDGMGIEVQRQAAYRSDMLRAPIRQLAGQGSDQGPVSDGLNTLRQQMTRLDPARQAPQGGPLARLLARIPGVPSPLQRYFRRFETAQDALDAVIRDLESGAERLQRDNLTLADDQQAFRSIGSDLEEQIRLGRLIDGQLVEASDDEAVAPDQRRFIREELLFPLRQRITDLQQQLAVTQQGVLALEVLIRNNRELVRGVERAINVTTSALNVAVTVALALANQRLVLERVDAVNRTTSDLISGTATALKQQGAEIQNRAGSATLDMEQLEQSFRQVLDAIEDVSRYREEALPVLAQQIQRMDAMAREGQAAIHRLDEGSAANRETRSGEDDSAH